MIEILRLLPLTFSIVTALPPRTGGEGNNSHNLHDFGGAKVQGKSLPITSICINFAKYRQTLHQIIFA